MTNKNNAILLAIEKGYTVTKDGKILNPKGNELKFSLNYGYPEFSIRYNTKSIKIKIHRLQAYQKYGNEIFEDNIEVRHLNGNKLDPSWDNITIGTHSENMNDIPKQIRIEKAIHASSFLKKHDYDEIKIYYNEVRSYKKVMEKFNISSKGTLNYIIKR